MADTDPVAAARRPWPYDGPEGRARLTGNLGVAEPVPDRLAAELAAIRRRAEQITDEHDADSCDLNGETCTGHDAERLLAAVEAVLKSHQPGRIAVLGSLCKRHESRRFFSITSTEAADVAACADCVVTVYNTCAGCATEVRLEQCPARVAISRALLGEEGNDGHQ